MGLIFFFFWVSLHLGGFLVGHHRSSPRKRFFSMGTSDGERTIHVSLAKTGQLRLNLSRSDCVAYIPSVVVFVLLPFRFWGRP